MKHRYAYTPENCKGHIWGEPVRQVQPQDFVTCMVCGAKRKKTRAELYE